MPQHTDPALHATASLTTQISKEPLTRPAVEPTAWPKHHFLDVTDDSSSMESILPGVTNPKETSRLPHYQCTYLRQSAFNPIQLSRLDTHSLNEGCGSKSFELLRAPYSEISVSFVQVAQYIYSVSGHYSAL